VGTQGGRPAWHPQLGTRLAEDRLFAGLPRERAEARGTEPHPTETGTVCHMDIYRHSSVSSVIQRITHAAKGERQRNREDPPAGPGCFPLPVHRTVCCSYGTSQVTGPPRSGGDRSRTPCREAGRSSACAVHHDSAALCCLTQTTQARPISPTGWKPIIKLFGDIYYKACVNGLWHAYIQAPQPAPARKIRVLEILAKSASRLCFVAWLEKRRPPVPSSTSGLGPRNVRCQTELPGSYQLIPDSTNPLQMQWQQHLLYEHFHSLLAPSLRVVPV